MASYRIERLDKQERSRFDCGVPELDAYLQRQAGQDQRRRVAACYVLAEQSTGEIVGYYTLSAGSILLADLPQKLSKKLPRYPTVPVVQLGRLAVAGTHQGKKLGGILLFDAIKRATDSDIGGFAVIVDAKDYDAVAFYAHHGFTAFESKPRVLFLPVSAALRRLAQSAS